MLPVQGLAVLELGVRHQPCNPPTPPSHSSLTGADRRPPVCVGCAQAGAGLPSFIAALNGARKAVVTGTRLI